MPLTTLLDATCPVIRLTGDIDMPVCYALIDELKLLHDYYQFRKVELQIDSPGGSADALHQMVISMRDWSKGNERILKTVALNQACSAAAMLLSFGTVGHRHAMSTSRLLYHEVRSVTPQNTVQTIAQLRMMGRNLEEFHGKFLNMLSEHCCAPGKDVAAYRRSLKKLFQKEKFIDAEEAKAFSLIDRVVSHAN
jgi:ATP-dependent Clp protease, protease subunit